MKLFTVTKSRSGSLLAAMAVACVAMNLSAQPEVAAPPTLGEDTKGTPAFDEKASLPVTPTEETAEETAQQEEVDTNDGLLGTASITESRRDNGQVYEVEIDHSLGGGKQYFEENDSDGSLETTPKDLEAIPNLPKWKLGTW